MIILQIIFSFAVLSLSDQQRAVLGLSSNLAQADIVPPEVLPTETPTENPSPTPAESPAFEINASSTPMESASPIGSPETSPGPENPTQSQIILDPSNTINSIENVSQNIIDQAVQEDSKLNTIVDPEAKNDFIIETSSNQVAALNELISNNSHTDANFTIQRLNSKIETAINNVASLPETNKNNALQKLTNFCKSADPSLRLLNLLAPEEIQQDIEITRGLCQGI